VLVQGGRAAEALGLLDAALKKRASSAALLNGRCWFKALTETDLAGALADCSRAIEISAEPSTFFDSRAMVHFRAGRNMEALQDLDSALAIEPELAASRFMRGLIASREGKREAAASDLGAARRLMPSIDAFFARYGIKP
jgi:tetratricopeptide (TPR) repeat protein